MLTNRQWDHLRRLPATGSAVSKQLKMSASGSISTLSRMEGREVRSHYDGNKRVFRLTAMGERAMKKAEERYK